MTNLVSAWTATQMTPGRRRLATDRRGDLAIILHSHMPYVEGFGTWPFGEEWLWEAIACVYLPLVSRFAGAPVTISLTPVLCDQLEALAGPAGRRFQTFLRDTRARLHEDEGERLRLQGDARLLDEVARSASDYACADHRFSELGPDLLAAFTRLEPAAQLWTSALTHSVLPLLSTAAGRRLQVQQGIASHRRRFGGWCGGFWLPECAYAPGLERELICDGLVAFCVDQTAVLGLGAPDHLEPIRTHGGGIAVPIDWEIARLVWDGPQGYPGAPSYRDYHNGTDNDVKLWSNDGRRYERTIARSTAHRHGSDFLGRVAKRLDDYKDARGRRGLVCVALDTEILGHWWYEGLDWLEVVMSDAASFGIRPVSLPEGLERHTPVRRPVALSSWGTGKDLSTWNSSAVADLRAAASQAEHETIAAVCRAGPSRAKSPALQRAVRELLAIQASDWAFMRTYGRAGSYPDERLAGHYAGLDCALHALDDASVDPTVRNLAAFLDISSLYEADARVTRGRRL